MEAKKRRSLIDNLLGDHEFKAGWQYTHSWQDKLVSIPGGGTYTEGLAS